MENSNIKPTAGNGLKAFARWGGSLATLLCLAFVGWTLGQSGNILADVAKSPTVMFTVLVMSVAWVVLNLMLGVGWLALVRLQRGHISFRESVVISFKSQFAKYLPGNVFHLAGRVLHGRNAGLSTSVCVLATTLESVTLVVLAVLIGLPLLVNLLQAIPIGIAALGLGIAIIFVYLWVRVDRLSFAMSELFSNTLASKRLVILAISSYAVVFLIQTLSFIAFSEAFSFDFGWTFLESIRIVSVTWVAGFVVIGSPGGLGVREAAFSVFAESPDIRSSLLIVASSMRISSILGDVASLGLGVLMARNSEEKNC